MVETAPYGTWPSPITADLVVAKARTIQEIQLDQGDVYWLEGRPDEDGRYVVVRRRADGAIEDVTPAGSNVRTRVHEYGGGAYLVADGTVWFVEFTDQRVYRLTPGSEPTAITPEPERSAGVRFADFDLTPDRRHLVCVRESHHGDAAEDVENEIVALPSDGDGEPVVLASGRDFYASPRVSPDGSRLAYVSWDHPNMPWDETEVVAGDLDLPTGVRDAVTVAGGAGAGESAILPAWSPDGVLHLVSDRGTGWWNLYRWDDGELRNLAPVEAELGKPQWVFGNPTYGFLADGRVAVIATRDAVARLSVLDPESGRVEPIDVPHTSVWSLRSDGSRVVYGGCSPTDLDAVLTVDVTSGRLDDLFRPRDLPVDPEWVSTPEAISFATPDGETSHAFYYPAHSPTHAGPEDERPPLIVTSHGGPTSHSSPQLLLSVQFWTSRGFGVVDVNYRGSTGFGRPYRQALNGTWGIYDVDDCVAAARFLGERGAVDPSRTTIRGGSASGYTTLCALVFHDLFAAGASYYGVADLALLTEETHKFESRYLDRLVGPYPEDEAVYRQRSPIHHAERLSAPVVLFQGLEDRVVPPDQAEILVDALERNGLPYAYVAFPGEQHGFRKAENLRRCLEAELSFYGQVLGFEPADPIEPLDVTNL
jgi:dipeptidyl aminopeptidase/acylaminoacyl peptidase